MDAGAVAAGREDQDGDDGQDIEPPGGLQCPLRLGEPSVKRRWLNRYVYGRSDRITAVSRAVAAPTFWMMLESSPTAAETRAISLAWR